MKELKHLNKYLRKYFKHLLLGTIFIFISNYFLVEQGPVVRYGFNLIESTFNIGMNYKDSSLFDNVKDVIFSSALLFFVIILAFALIRGFFLFLTRQTIIVMSRLIEYDLKNELYEHYQALPLSFYRKNNTGDLVARISEDVSKVRMYVGPAIMYGINLVSTFILVIYKMLSVSPMLTMYVLLPLPILSVGIYFINNKINKRSELLQRSLSGLTTYVQEAFSGIRVIKAFNRENSSAAEFNEQSNNYKNKALKLAITNAFFFPLIIGLIGLSTVLTIYVGGIEIISGELSAGNIAEFLIYLNNLMWPVVSLGWVSSVVQRAAASQKRLNEFLQEKTDIVSTKNSKTPIDGAIRFDNVSFTYPKTGITALKNISFEVKKGESLAIIGTTGSGKSTVADLLCRMYDVSRGTILIDDKDIKAYNIQHLRSKIGYVPQDVFLFSDSIKNNIGFGSDDFNDEAIIQAAKDADLYDNVTGFPKGFETMLGERGITLSGGQKQRTSIARAIVRNPKILILDDALSAVDTKTEDAILDNLKRIMKDRTSIIISHRVSSVKLADKIIVLQDGEIVEKGTHERLLTAGGVYQSLYEAQLQSENN